MKTKLSAQLITFFSGFSGPTAYLTIFGVLLFCGLGVPIPEDITLISAGILAGLKTISLPGAMIVGFIGVMAGDTILYMLGRKLGHRVFTLPVFKKIFTEQRIKLAEQKILSNSKFICFTARFLPGLRSPIFLTAGIMGVRPIVFFGLDGVAALISVPVWVWVGYWFGQNIDDALAVAKKIQIYLFSGVVTLIIGYVLFYYIKNKNKRINQNI